MRPCLSFGPLGKGKGLWMKVWTATLAGGPGPSEIQSFWISQSVSRSSNSHFLRIQEVSNTKDVFLGHQTFRSSSIWHFRVRQSVC